MVVNAPFTTKMNSGHFGVVTVPLLDTVAPSEAKFYSLTLIQCGLEYGPEDFELLQENIITRRTWLWF